MRYLRMSAQQPSAKRPEHYTPFPSTCASSRGTIAKRVIECPPDWKNIKKFRQGTTISGTALKKRLDAITFIPTMRYGMESQ